MKLKVKLAKGAQTPKYTRDGDIGMDLVAISKDVNNKKGYTEFDTGVHVEIPEGYGGFIYPRSSISNTVLTLTNSVGVIDQNYRGSIKLRFSLNSAGLTKYMGPGIFDNQDYNAGDRIGQLIIHPLPKVEVEIVDSLSDTVRGEGAYGSSGN